MITKIQLIRQNEYLQARLEERRQEINELNKKLNKPIASVDFDLQAKYMLLQAKYKKLLNDITSKDTEIIIYNGNAYRIKSIDFHKQPDELDSINIEAINVPQDKGLINNLTVKTFTFFTIN